MVIAGFNTSSIGFLTYALICALTAGIGYLVFRWVPRWRIRFVGIPAPLRKCSWVVVEVSHQTSRRGRKIKAKTSQNQWGEFTVHYIRKEDYGYAMSSVFNAPSKEKSNGHRYDDDPELKFLRYLDYRYMRLIYHPSEDKFVLNNDWWDPQWTDVKALRAGLDSEEREPRDQVFGKNMIEIQEKTIPQLLMDEVSTRNMWQENTDASGLPPVLHLPNRKLGFVVDGRVLLLRGGHLLHFTFQHHNNHCRNTFNHATIKRNIKIRMRCASAQKWFLAPVNFWPPGTRRCVRGLRSFPFPATL